MDLAAKAEVVLQRFRELGTEEAGVSLEHSILREINYENGDFSLYRTVESYGVDLQAIKEAAYATMHANCLDEESLLALTAACAAATASAPRDEARHLTDSTVQVEATRGPLHCEQERLFELVTEFIKDIEVKHADIVISSVCCAHDYRKLYRAFSSGARYWDEQGKYSLFITYSSVRGEENSSFYYNALDFTDLETPLIDREPFKHDLAHIAEQYKAEPLQESFHGTLVMTPACVQEMLSYLLFNFTGDSALITSSSPWQEKLDEQVVDQRLTLQIAPLDERFLGGALSTSEGYPADNYTVFEQGVLKSFSLSDYAARTTGKERARNSQNYSFMILEADESKDLADMIAEVDQGIYMMRFSGGEPAANGDFSGIAKNSFLIQQGKLSQPLREVMINSNLAQMFRNIGMFSRERINDGSNDLPWLSFPNIFISGK